jgi:hypothetical protein
MHDPPKTKIDSNRNIRHFKKSIKPLKSKEKANS